MRIPRVFDPQPLSAHQDLVLGAFAAQHLGRVLRMRPGDQITLFNGQGGEFGAELVEVTKKTVLARLGARRDVAADPGLAVELGQCLSRGERMEFAVQKATELGVSAIAPLFSARCEVRLQGERLAKRRQHLQQVAISACEQCGRSRVPDVTPATTLLDWVASVDADLKLILHPDAARPFAELAALRPTRLAILVGPEGGLSDEEIDAAESAGFVPVLLGPRVLRTETAPLAVLTLAHYLWGDIA